MAASSLRLACLSLTVRPIIVVLTIGVLVLGNAPTLLSEVTSNEKSNSTARIGIVLPFYSVDESILDSLRKNGLYESAVARCRSAIASATPGSMNYARWTSRLVAVLADRDGELAESPEIALAEAKKIHEAIVADEKHASYRVWNDYAFESVRYNVANRSVATYLAAPTNMARRNDALVILRSILDQLDRLEVIVQTQMGKSLRQTDRESPILARELASLLNRILLLKIDCFLLRSECYPFGSDDHIATGAEALSVIESMSSRVDPEWSGRSSLEFARFQCLIATNRIDDARLGLEKWIPAIADVAIQYRAIALAAKACQLKGDFVSARKILSLANNDLSRGSPEIALAFLELQIAETQKAKNDLAKQHANGETGNQQIEIVLKAKDDIAKRFGRYWERRAEALIVASSYVKAGADSSTTSPQSLDLIKLEIRQRLAAGDISGAVARLEQAEAAAFAANDLPQAFSLAKATLGLMLQQNESDSTFERVSATARKYSKLPGAAELHQTAIEHVMKFLTANQNIAIDEKYWGRYRDILAEHLDLWPDHTTTGEDRARLQALFFVSNDIESLIGLWREEAIALSVERESSKDNRDPTADRRFEEANIQLVNALLLATLTTEKHSLDFKQNQNGLDRISSWHKAIFEVLSGDFTWWTFDGGIRQSDGRIVEMNIDAPDWAINGHPSSIQRILLAAQRGAAQTIEADIRSLVDWFKQDQPARLGWLLATTSTISEILRIRALNDFEKNEQKNWATLLSHLRDSLPVNAEENALALHPLLFKAISGIRSIVEIRIAGLRGETGEGKSIVEALKKSEPRNALWTLEGARLYEMQGGVDLETSLDLYRQLATRSVVGSELWFEAKFCSARCLRKMSNQSESEAVVALVQAMVADLPAKWKKRTK